MDFWREHVNHILLTVMIIFFTLVTIFFIYHDGYQDGFKWSSAIAGGFTGALLMLMRGAGNYERPTPEDKRETKA